MSNYTPLFNSIITSSIWGEDVYTRVVWITMLALADADGMVEGSVPGLARVAHVPLDACSKALGILSAPDPFSRSDRASGARIAPVEGGWHIINHAMYRDRAKSRAAYMRKYREKKKKNQKEEKTLNINTNGVVTSNSRNSNVTPVTVTQPRLFPLPGKVCGIKKCVLPAVYKSAGEYPSYYCYDHSPKEVKEKYRE